MPLPPMEWIKLKPAGSTSPPAIAHGCLSGPTAATSSSLPGAGQAYLFGGRSAAGSSINSIYILNYDTDPPTWSQPTTSPSTIFTSTPSARSHMLCGWDAASNYRNQFTVYGGRSNDGNALGDFWVFDQANSFWAQANQIKPSAPPNVYGAMGGIDPVYIPSSPSTASALMIAGGSNSSANIPLTPVGIVIDGQLGSNTDTITLNVTNLASGVGGDPATHNLISGRWGTSSAIMPGSKLVLFSGCNTSPADEFSNTPSATCALPNGGILSFASTSPATLTSATTSTWQAFNYCPAPRVGGTMVPNRNTFDSSFAQQVILLGGRADSVNWNDQGGSSLGEVDVLDIGSGVWARVVPGHKEGEIFTPKTGIIALALSGSVGKSTTKGTTDILVYGGIDVSTGQGSNELWILRLHPARMTGNGTTSGVTMSYLPSCVTPTPSNSVNSSTGSSDSGSGTSSSVSRSDLTVSDIHTFLTTIPLATLLLSITALRYEEPGLLSFSRMWRMPRLWALLTAWAGLLFSLIGLILGVIAGLTHTRLNSRTPSPSSSKSRFRRSLFKDDSDVNISASTALTNSTHSKLGLAIMAAGFVVVPTLYLSSWLYGQHEAKQRAKRVKYGERRRLKAKVVARSRWNPVRWMDRLVNGHGGGVSKKRRPQAEGRESEVTAVEKALGMDKAQQAEEQPAEEEQTGETDENLTHGRMESTSTTRTRGEPGVCHSVDDGELQEIVAEVGERLPPAVGAAEEPDLATSENDVSLSMVVGESSARLNGPPPRRKPASTLDSPKPAVLRALHNFSNTILELAHAKKPEAEKTEDKSSFEVLNRRALSRSALGPGPPKPALCRRRSLDLSIELDNSRGRAEEHLSVGSPDAKTYSLDQDQVRAQESEAEEEDDDDDDDSTHRKVPPRTKLRRLADVLLHTVLFLANVFVIVSFFTSTVSRWRWVGVVYLVLCIVCYGVMGWLAWKGRPSAESTMVIFMSIIRNGTSDGADQAAAQQQATTGQGQFLSYGQPSPLQRPTPNADLRPHSITSTALYHPLHAPVHNFGAVGSEAGGPESEFGAGVFWPDHQLGSIEGCGGEEEVREGIELGEHYWREREVQIVTTAPRRRLAVVNG
ncbi:hypothetical protein CROQUDRAFT_653263 [Cronartium quercuum f. sp. fusiforme G11]|uniref:Uncharacterized protein n=1 Tax=Cronartium quercuum f. sp. fusiforme G11 TaxID=708437 RepID=A0A9P6TET5_9BASI|nr:hypothetical protein CROQUDRAFT_653263 [Cronartium quercuum f. sp. fusiforme G11]